MSRPDPNFDPAWRAWDDLRRPIWLFDPHGLRGVYANASACALWGAASREELLARDFSQLSPAVRARTERLAKATARGDEISERWTFYPNGAPVTVQATISTYRLLDGSPVLLFEASPVDAEPEERRALEALRHTDALISLFDRDGRNLFSNPAAFGAFGRADLPFEARFAEPEIAGGLMDQALTRGSTDALAEVVTRGGRRWHRLDVRVSLDPVTGGQALLLNEIDVTGEVEARAAQAEAERAAAAAAARQSLLATLSHELRTPLNAVLGFSGLLSEQGLSFAQAEQVARIHEAGDRLRLVVDEIIALADGGGAIPDGERRDGAPIGTAPDRALRVLYVDDHPANRALVHAVLTSQGVDCVLAEDGAEGVEAARTGAWDLILMDVQMPVMDGVTATRTIRALPGPASRVPIVALTANTLAADRRAYAEAGMVDCLAKPASPGDLMAAVVRWACAPAGPDLTEPVPRSA
ncbi:response regulator [Brevundimonas fluminis]|jgi:CheY-like chemotaxis protein/nitrogen-specific signal transduction histidine kinase|uniref:hybrid sensor histidine kinase/response regulator n=1 Tax=Brevundimonas fluminis TaxID=2487274 RepID=UPI000F656EB6|nr:response regulator [Brevundimonas fluminis]